MKKEMKKKMIKRNTEGEEKRNTQVHFPQYCKQ